MICSSPCWTAGGSAESASNRTLRACALSCAPDKAHARREIFEAESADPEGVREGLRRIGALYDIEEDIREQKLTGEAKRLHRLTHSKPHVEAFFDWVDRSLEAHGLRPKNPFINALHYARERRAGLEVFLSDPDVSPDTNHLERALRVIPMGRKNWNFCWTELGAKHVGIVESVQNFVCEA